MAQQSGSQQPIQPPVFIQPALPPGPAVLPGPAVPAEPVEQGEERLEILPENIRPFEPIKYDQYDKLAPAEAMRYLQMVDQYAISQLPLKPKGGSLFRLNLFYILNNFSA